MTEANRREQVERMLDQVQESPRRRFREIIAAARMCAGDSLGENEMALVIELAVAAQVERGPHGLFKEAMVELAMASEAMDRGLDPRAAIAFAATAACLFEQLGRKAGLSSLAEAAAFQQVNVVDDMVVRRHGRYALRSLVLRRTRDGLAKVSNYVRHVDLVVRFKWAIELAATDDEIVTLDAIEELQALIGEIDARIAVTLDAEGPGVAPSGKAVHRNRLAGELRRQGELVLGERYRSLPRLRAQVLSELGQILTSAGFSSSKATLERAATAFEQASVAYMAVAAPEESAYCAVLAVQCMDWMTSHVDGDELGAHLERIYEHGRRAHRQVLESGLEKEKTLSLGVLGRNAYQQAEWALRLRSLNDPTHVEPTIKDIYRQIWMQLAMLRDLVDRDPWAALTCGVVAIEHLGGFLGPGQAEAGPDHDEAEARAHGARKLETLRHYVTQDVVAAMLRGLERVLDEGGPPLREDPIGAPAPDVWLPRPSPTSMWRRLHRVLSAALHAAATNDGLTGAQWGVVARAFASVRPMALPTNELLELRARESDALAASARIGIDAGIVAGYVRDRIEVLERHAIKPILSVSERLLIAGWISHLVQGLRELTDDLAEHTAEDALALIERSGATAFRTETLLFGRGETAPAVFGRVEKDSLSDPSLPASARAEAWSRVHLGRNLLDFWSRAKMIIEAGQTSPSLREAFAEVLADPPTTMFGFPPETSFESLSFGFGATRSEVLHREDRTVMRFTWGSHAEIDAHVDPTRSYLVGGLQALARLGDLVPSDFAACPGIDVETIQAHLVAGPNTAVVVPGFWPDELTGLNVFTVRDGRLHRELVERPAANGDQAAALRVAHEFLDAVSDDRREASGASWQRMGEHMVALAAVFDPWTRALATALDADGTRRVLFLLRGQTFPRLPWEMFAADDDGMPFGERFEIGATYTMCNLPDAPALRARAGVAQIYGAGTSLAQMQLGASAMRMLAAAGLARPPIPGDEALGDERLHELSWETERVRLFVHGHHDRLLPDADRLTFVDAATPLDCMKLYATDLRRLPLAGSACVELWACEGAAHGRALQEHGVSDEPEDLTAALLLAGARRVVAARWHVPNLPSALLMERFAMLVDTGMRDTEALSAACRDYRRAFGVGGLIDRVLVEELAKVPLDPDPLAGLSGALGVGPTRFLLAAIEAQRRAWYAGTGYTGPVASLAGDADIQRLAKWMTPREEAVAAVVEPASAMDAVADLLRPYRNPACWAGWRVTLRDLGSAG